MNSPNRSKLKRLFHISVLVISVATLFLVISACTQQDQKNAVVVPDLSLSLSDNTQPTVDVNQVVNTFQQGNRLVTTAVGDNLLVNPAFEQGSLGWTACDGASYTTTTDSVSGNAAKLASGCFFQTVDASAGKPTISPTA